MAGFTKTKSADDGGSTMKSTVSDGIAVGGTASRPADPKAGEFRYNSDTNALEYYDGSVYKSISYSGTVAVTQDSFTGDGSTLAFTMSTSVTGNEEQRVIVAVGNVFQNPASAYTVSGTTCTFTSPPGSSETITIIHGLDSNVATS
jgi:hypothetical protein|tara:strand:- start:883 stop:1320 length:438 start_codon:yes stop_codon:yes gene_type:complete